MNDDAELFEAESVLASVNPARPPVMSPKRRAIMEYLRLNGVITLPQATALVGRNVYHNASKHTGALLSAMVKAGLLVRSNPGVFKNPS